MDKVLVLMEIELDRRKALIDQAREALKPFADVGEYLHGNEFNELFSTGGLRISMADLKRAAQALAAMEATQ